MTFEEFQTYMEHQARGMRDMNKTVRPGVLDPEVQRKAFSEYGDAPHRAAFYLLTGKIA